MFVEISIVLLSTLIEPSRCSLVIDNTSQDALYVADYCPTMKYCMEGAHVMCMYYNPQVKMGPRCSNPQNVSVTRELATKLLDVSNAIRSKIALGKEKGKNGQYLPKAYGMFRLKWDSELATFAQVLANQCVLRHDLCRATKRFPDPGQTVGLVRFTMPDWYPVSRSQSFTTPGISAPKIMYAVMQSLKSWYGQKNFVTEDMLLKYPDWTRTPNDQNGRLYMEMVYASATHMGCGISAYTGYAFYDNQNALNYNHIQVICNFSARPRQGGKVFNTKPPGGTGFTIQCGCPMGSREDIDCLCNEYERVEMKPKPIARSCPNREACEPTTVLLPIFTVEDAPPDKLMARTKAIQAPLTSYIRERFDNTSMGRSLQSREIFDFFAETETERSISHALKSAMNLAPPLSPTYKSSRQFPRESNKYSDVIKRYSDRSPIRSPAVMAKPQYHPQSAKFFNSRKSSVFARAEKFSLPGRKGIGPFDIVIKKDVAPRKDFSNVQQLVNSYLKKRRFGEEGSHKGKTHEERLSKAIFNFEEDLTTETTLNRVEEKVMSYKHYLKAKSNNTEEHKTSTMKINDENENKLMTLLDTLEREVKHIELDGNEKEIFDAKIRKIYGTVVGKPVDLLTQKQTKQIDTDLHTDYNLENELMDLTHFSDDDTPKHETNRQTSEIRRHENHITEDDRKVDIHYSNKRANTIKNYDDLDGKRTRPTKNQNDDDVTKDVREYKHNIVLSDEDVKTRNYDKYSETERGYKSGVDLKLRTNDEIGKGKAFYAHKNDDRDDQISIERRKYYQDKLENLERRLHDARTSKHRNEHGGGERTIRRMRPNREEMQLRPSRSKSQIDAFYMPDRARYVHGY